jgi:hypothetical protein
MYFHTEIIAHCGVLPEELPHSEVCVQAADIAGEGGGSRRDGAGALATSCPELRSPAFLGTRFKARSDADPNKMYRDISAPAESSRAAPCERAPCYDSRQPRTPTFSFDLPPSHRNCR